MKSNTILPLKLQFFAEPNTDGENQPGNDGDTATPKPEEKAENKGDAGKEKPQKDNEGGAKKEPSAQELMLEIARLKRSNDKLAKENGDLNKKYRATLSEQEVANMEKAEAEAAKEARLAELERKDKVHDLTENFMDLGYSKDLAKKAAEAQVDGDTATLFDIQQKVQDALLKAKEAEWLKSRPEINASNSPKEPEDLFIKGFDSVPTRFGK